MSALNFRDMTRSARLEMAEEDAEEQAVSREMSLLRSLTGNQALMQLSAMLDACKAELAAKTAECARSEAEVQTERARCDAMNATLTQLCSRVDAMVAEEGNADDSEIKAKLDELLRLEREEREPEPEDTKITAMLQEPGQTVAAPQTPPSAPAAVPVLPDPPKRRASRIKLVVRERDPNGMPSVYEMTPEY
jgi:chromosome segregation ATPase